VRLGYKILLPQALMILLLLIASAALLRDLKQQEEGLRATSQRLERDTRLAGLVKDVHTETAVEVLSYRIDKKARRIEATLSADREAENALKRYAVDVTDPLQHALMDAVVESRDRIRRSRLALIQAIDAGKEGEIQAAFDRWRIHRRLLDASLNDWSALSLYRFASASEEAIRGRAAIVRLLLYGVALAIAIAAAAFFYVRLTVSRPLGMLVNGIASFGGGKLGVRIDPRIQDSSDEVGQMAKAFNKMALDIEDLNRGLELRVHERTAQLEAANKELESFAYSVSHDLRAPLRTIDGFSKILEEDYSEKVDEEGRDSLRRVRAAAQKMGHLIDDILKLSRLSRSDMTYEQVDLGALADSIVAELRSTESTRRVTYRVAPGLVARGDKTLIRILLENLLANSWKFTSKHSTAQIEVGAAQKEGELAYFVRDDGAGFDMAHVGALFAPFQRLHGMSEFPGTGIGLATVRRVVQRHGGRCWAEGEVEKGATFYFTLGAQEPTLRLQQTQHPPHEREALPA